VGNKRDLEVQREVSLQEANQFAKENGKYAKMSFWDTYPNKYKCTKIFNNFFFYLQIIYKIYIFTLKVTHD